MDLVATVTQKGEQVDVSRLNGQRVFGAAFEEEDEDRGNVEGDDGNARDGNEVGKGFVRDVTWRRDGELPFTIPCLRPFRFQVCVLKIRCATPKHPQA